MDQVFVINPKGGCGKTTIATQLAAYYALHQTDVMLADHDAQKSSSDWLAARPESIPKVKSVATRPERAFDHQGASLVIHDMPAASSLKDIQSIVKTGDRFLIPVLSSPTDIKACLRFIMALYREGVTDTGVELGLVANRVRRRTSYHQVLLAFLDRLDIPLVGTIRDTQNYIRIMDAGLSVFDLPDARMRRELEEWQPILDWLS
jgi:chromosome partitioning protein